MNKYECQAESTFHFVMGVEADDILFVTVMRVSNNGHIRHMTKWWWGLYDSTRMLERVSEDWAGGGKVFTSSV